MEEPPAQVPRHTTSLTRLWRRHDLADSVTKFLPTQALAVLPNLSRSFEQDKFRMLLVAMRASKSAAACTGALLSTLQTSGRDAGHYHNTWERTTGKGWRRGKALRAATKSSQVSLTTGRYSNLPNERFLRLVRLGEYDDSSRNLFLYQLKIGKSCPAASAAAFVESVFSLRTTGLLITGVAPSVVNLPCEDLHPTRIGAATLSAETY